MDINGEQMDNLLHADDVVVITESLKDLQIILTELEGESKNVGLKINRTKTKVMVNVSDARQVTLETDILEMMEDYI